MWPPKEEFACKECDEAASLPWTLLNSLGVSQYITMDGEDDVEG